MPEKAFLFFSQQLLQFDTLFDVTVSRGAKGNPLYSLTNIENEAGHITVPEGFCPDPCSVRGYSLSQMMS